MFSEEAKKFIELEVANVDGRADSDFVVEDVPRKIFCLEQALKLSEHIERLSGLKESIVNQIEYMAKNKKVDSIEEFEKTAQYLELFIYLIDPENFDTIRGTASGNKSANNSQAIPNYLYTLKMIDDEKQVGYLRSSYKKAESYKNYSDMFKVYGNLYYIRNEEAHSVRLLSPTQEWQYVRDLLILYLEVAGHYEQKLATEINRTDLMKETRVEEYLKEMKENYEKEASEKYLKYIVLDGRQTNTNSKESLVSLIRKNDNCKIKIIGNAGMGKTTTLKYLAYTDILESKGRTPIFLELREVSMVENNILEMIGNKNHLNCKEEMVKKILENGYINLYIDGINELYDTDLKKNVVNQINSIITTYPKTKVILTDRESNKITVTDNVLTYIIEQLDDNKIKEFIKNNTNGDTELSNKVQKLVDSNDSIKNMVRIPFRLYKLITIMLRGKDIPKTVEEFDILFRNAIIEREVEDKASQDADNLLMYLENIISLNQKEYSRSELIEVISYTIKDRNLSNTASDDIIRLLLDLHIMEKVSFQTYRFVNHELQKTSEDKKEELETSDVKLEGII